MLPTHGHNSMSYQPVMNWSWSGLPTQPDQPCETCYHLYQAYMQHYNTHSPNHFAGQPQLPVFQASNPLLFAPPEKSSSLSTSVPAQFTSDPSTTTSCPITPFFPPPSEHMNFPKSPRSIHRPGATIPTLPFATSASTKHHCTYHSGLPSTSVPSSTDPSPFPSPASAVSFSSQLETSNSIANELQVPSCSRAESLQSGRKKPRPKGPDYGTMRKMKACEECRRLKRKCSPNHPGVRINWADSEYNTRSEG